MRHGAVPHARSASARSDSLTRVAPVARAGKYHYTTSEGVLRENLARYHEGIVTEIRRDGDKRVYVGKHTKDECDDKFLGYSGYEPTWERELSQLRVCGNLMAAISGFDDADDHERE